MTVSNESKWKIKIQDEAVVRQQLPSHQALCCGSCCQGCFPPRRRDPANNQVAPGADGAKRVVGARLIATVWVGPLTWEGVSPCRRVRYGPVPEADVRRSRWGEGCWRWLCPPWLDRVWFSPLAVRKKGKRRQSETKNSLTYWLIFMPKVHVLRLPTSSPHLHPITRSARWWLMEDLIVFLWKSMASLRWGSFCEENASCELAKSVGEKKILLKTSLR